MKKIFTAVLLLSLINGFSQVRKAALIFLQTSRPQVTFFGSSIVRPTDAPKIFFENGASFKDTTMFNALKNKLNSLLPQLGFRLLPEDSVITTDNYKEMIKKAEPGKMPNEIIAKGYASIYASAFGLNEANKYFEIPPVPDVVLEATAYFELNYLGVQFGKTLNYATLNCGVFIKAFNSKGKKVFKFNELYKSTTHVLLQPDIRSPWGWVINGDISILQKETLDETLKLIDAEIPEQKEKIDKYFLKH